MSYNSQTILLKKDDQYFSISKDYFDTDTLSFRSVHLSSDDLPNVELKTLNNPIEINGVSYIPSDYIDFSEYKICIVDFLKDKEKNIITVNYNLSETSLNKAEIKIKDEFKTEENYHTKITGSNTQYIKYKYYPEDTEYLDTENIGDRIYEKDFYMYFKFINQDCILNNIIGYGALNNKFELLKTQDVDIFKDFYKGKIYIRFKKDYEYSVNINYLTKENAVLINNESLEEVK